MTVEKLLGEYDGVVITPHAHTMPIAIWFTHIRLTPR
jgi:hypothetical protein